MKALNHWLVSAFDAAFGFGSLSSRRMERLGQGLLVCWTLAVAMPAQAMRPVMTRALGWIEVQRASASFRPRAGLAVRYSMRLLCILAFSSFATIASADHFGPYIPWDPETYAGCGAPVPAFPGAEGYGADVTCGGRGGQILVVSNLDDDGEGSLRDALRLHNGGTEASIIVFRVGGTIVVNSSVQESGLFVLAPNLTIAGQTAPGDGILIRTPLTDGYTDGCTTPACYLDREEDGRFTPFNIAANNVIVRHLRIRSGNDPDWTCDDDRDDDGICWADAATTSACTLGAEAPITGTGPKSGVHYDNCPRAQNGPLGGTCVEEVATDPPYFIPVVPSSSCLRNWLKIRKNAKGAAAAVWAARNASGNQRREAFAIPGSCTTDRQEALIAASARKRALAEVHPRGQA